MDRMSVRRDRRIFRFLAVLCRLRRAKSDVHTEGTLAVQLVVLWVEYFYHDFITLSI